MTPVELRTAAYEGKLRMGCFLPSVAGELCRKEVSVLRTYEALYVVKPDVEDDEIQTMAKEVETLVTDGGGAIVRSETWGNRRLAYDIKGYSEGCYILLRFTAETDCIPRLENHFRLAERVIRFLVVHFDERTLRLEAEQQQHKEEEARANAEELRRREAKVAGRIGDAQRREAERGDDAAAKVREADEDKKTEGDKV